MKLNNFLVFVLFALVSCNTNQNSFIVNVQTDRVGDAILQKIDLSNEIIDTTNIKNGKFSFKKNINEEELYRLKFFDGTSFDILANSGENISINYIGDNLTVDGSVGTEKIIEMDDKLYSLLLFRDSLTRELQSISDDENYESESLEARQKFFKALGKHQEYLKSFIAKNSGSKACLIALFQNYGQSSPVLTVDEHLETFELVLSNLKTNYPESSHINLLEEEIEKFKPLAYGQPAPNFTLPNLNGDLVSLTDFKNKVILIDFWASWCKPCRMENPKLVKLHKKFSKNDFEIISVSLDGTQRQTDSRTAWEKAIKDDKLSDWVHLSELKGWETYVRELYNFSSIPYTVIIDKEGKIAAKNLRGLDLDLKINELVNAKR
jgi:thiol-disulfide isomerase/thioredoxin